MVETRSKESPRDRHAPFGRDGIFRGSKPGRHSLRAMCKCPAEPSRGDYSWRHSECGGRCRSHPRQKPKSRNCYGRRTRASKQATDSHPNKSRPTRQKEFPVNEQLSLETVRVDFHNADRDGCVRLNSAGAIADLSRLGATLVEGLCLRITDGEIIVVGTVRSPGAEGVWRIAVDWAEVGRLHASR